jgi:hypothetical protein
MIGDITMELFFSHLPNIIGLFGVSFILWYYFLLQTGKIMASSLSFSCANFLGSCLLLISLWFNWNLAAVIIETAWMFISLYGIYRALTSLCAEKDPNDIKPLSQHI